MRLLKPKYFVATLVILCCFSTQKVIAQVNKQDSLVLVDFYNSTGGPNWTNHTNWLTVAPVSTWYGLTLDANKRVSQIEFFGFNLSGSIPPSFFNLSKLIYLDLGNNKLNGSIPSNIGNLKNLTHLDLSSNQLSGVIPNTIGTLTNLKFLSIGFNQLTGTLPDLRNLSNLGFLSISRNYISGSIPLSFGNLKSLIYMSLSENSLSGNIPDTIGNLSNLQTLTLFSNRFTGNIPQSLGNLKSLSFLSIYFTEVTGNIPETLGNLTNLQYLTLNDNYLTGRIPVTFGNLTKLIKLNIAGNQLSGNVPSQIAGLTNLQQLYLQGNHFTFEGMEDIVNLATGNNNENIYAPQAVIPLIFNNNILSVSVGGTPANDTFNWYKDSVLVSTKVGDSTYTTTSNGRYWVVATNSIATQLTLYSDTINITNLPVTLTFFTATTTNNTIQTNWKTANELNISHFIIQQSTDGSSFTDIGTVKAIGSGANGYSFTDNNPTQGINYYRLKSVDKDGSFSYSKVISVEIVDSRYEIVVVPNPAKEKVIVKGNHIVAIQVIDNLGRVLKNISFKDASNPVLTLAGMPAGVYHLRIQTSDGKVSGVGLVIN